MSCDMEFYDIDLANKHGIDVAVVYAHFCNICAEFYSNTMFYATIKEIMLSHRFLSHYKTRNALDRLIGIGLVEDCAGGYYKLNNWDDVVKFKELRQLLNKV